MLLESSDCAVNQPKMLLMVVLKSLGFMPSLTEKLETSEQLLMADNFLWASTESFLDVFLDIFQLKVMKKAWFFSFYALFVRSISSLAITKASICRVPSTPSLGRLIQFNEL